MSGTADAGEVLSHQSSGLASEPRERGRLHWHGEDDDGPMREWLVDQLLPKVGTALASGRWGTYKTFVVMDLAGAVMGRSSFAGRDIERQGGVVFIASEGQSELRIRLTAMVQEKIRPDLESSLPFAWVEECTKLTAPSALGELEIILAEAARTMLERFDMPLALVVFDTLSSSAGFKNADDTAENQRVMDVLKALSLRFDCLVLAVDHFGKNAESGTRNSSVKEDSVDAVLALLGERDAAGTISNPRMAIRKVRGGPTGGEIRFTPRVAQIGEDGAETTIVIDWPEQEQSSTATASGWRRDGRQLRVALEKALERSGRSIVPRAGEEPVQAVLRDELREEFYHLRAGDNVETRRKAFSRLLQAARSNGLVVCREVDGSDWVGFPAACPRSRRRDGTGQLL